MKLKKVSHHDLNRKVVFYQGTVQGSGMSQETVFEEKANVWAYVSPPKMKRTFKDGVINYKSGYDIIIRYRQRFETNTDIQLVINKGKKDEKKLKLISWVDREDKKNWIDIVAFEK